MTRRWLLASVLAAPAFASSSTTVYDRDSVTERDRVVGVFPILGRAGAVQR